MASLQESTIGGTVLGKGVNNILTNTVFGSGNAYSSGARNTSIGKNSGRAITGNDKVSIGYRAGITALYGHRTIHIGERSGVGNYGGIDTVAIGNFNNYFTSCQSTTIGNEIQTGTCNISNTQIGRVAFRYNTGCSTGIGANAGQAANSAGKQVAIGQAASQFYSSTGNTAIGACANRFGANSGTVQIGFYAYASSYSNNHFVIGKYSFTTAHVNVGWSNLSDCRDKTNVESLTDNLGLNFIRKLNPVSFKFDHRRKYMFKCGFEYGDKDGTLTEQLEHYGFLAQEVKEAAEALSETFDGVSYNAHDDVYGLAAIELIAPIVKALQQINEDLDLIEAQLT